ncbi:MAG: divalent cation tolerance protein CutA [Proteobacteria bacterium]|nr:divalent cation tolerance protein CutA [Pseudomonadota bacterium]MBU1688118.1 divalent cation tolerance protein CutA [Pseudomonadota bacterium]
MSGNMMHIGWTMTNDQKSAEKLARGAVEQKLAACAQLHGPVKSYYLWEGNLETVDEFRITFKFVAERAPQLERWLKENHPYEIPQWLAVQASEVLPEYWQWARENQGVGLEPEPGETPENAIELSKKGNRLLRAKNFHEAEKVLMEAYDLDPMNAYILVGLGDLYREQKKFGKAIGYYEKILSIDEFNVFALRGIGDSYRGMNQHEMAISYWKRYLECNRDDIQVMTRVGDSNKKIKNIKESEEYYLQALSFSEDDRYALLGIGSLYYKMEKDDRAVIYLERLLALDDSYVAVLTMVGNIYRRRQDYSGAIRYYEKAVHYEPGNTFALYGLGDCNRWMRNYEEVISWWTKILDKEPRNQVIHSRVGDAYLNLSQFDKALEHYLLSIQIRFDPYALLGMARIYRMQGNPVEAMRCCRQLLEQVPTNLRGLEEMVTLHREFGEPEKAQEFQAEFDRLRGL